MLLPPQLDQRLRDPAAHALEAMEPRVAGGAEGDQVVVGMPRMAMMDHQPGAAPADAALLVVAGEDFLAQSPEAGPGAGAPLIASLTPAPAKQLAAAAGAAEGDLGVRGHRLPIAYHKVDYHR